MNRIFNWLLPALALLGVMSCRYERDRYDEQVLGATSDHVNLYRRATLTALNGFNPASGGAGRVDYRVDMAQFLPDAAKRENADPDCYAVVTLLWDKQAPLLQYYQVDEKEKTRELRFSIPVDRTNARRIPWDDRDTEVFQLLLSLRYDTRMPILCKNNYEIFLLTLEHDIRANQWKITELKPVTAGKDDAIQPMFNADATRIAYVACSREGGSGLFLTDADGGNPRKVSDRAYLPSFLASGKLLFVRYDAMDRKVFVVCDPVSLACVPATDGEITEVIRCLPYSALKKFYTRLKETDSDKLPDAELGTEMTFEEILAYGLRNAPELMQAYYGEVAMQAQITQNLYDIGPDFFMGADYLVTSAILTDQNDEEDYYVIGDRIGQDNFVRGIAGLAIPVIPNLPLRWARRYYLDNQKAGARATLLRALNSYTGKITVLCFEYLQERNRLDNIRFQLRLSEQRLKRYQALAGEHDAYQERIMFAENINAGLHSALAITTANLIAIQVKIAAVTGMNADRRISLKTAVPAADIPAPDAAVHDVEWFAAMARVNRQEIKELDFKMAQFAAERDMGPESTRIDAVRVSISYGVGWLDWSKFVDDFLLMGVSYARPLRLPHFFQAYYDDWTARITSLRMQKYALIGQIRLEVFEAFTDYSASRDRGRHRQKRSDFLREQSRLSDLFWRYGNRHYNTPASTVEDFDAVLDSLDEKITAENEKFEQWLRLTKLYQAAGRADLLLSSVIKALETGKVPTPREKAKAPETSIYLWKSLDVITSKPAREKFIAMCRRHHIGQVYCYISMKSDHVPFTVKYYDEYVYFIESCRRNQIKVIALLGEPEWLMPATRGDMMILLNGYNEFNRKQAGKGAYGFSGCKLDVEPHASPLWKDHRALLMENYLSMLEQAGNVVGKKNLYADVSYRYFGQPCGKYDFLHEIGQRVGGMTVMAYLDNPAAVLAKMHPILERSDLDCKISAALETNDVGEPGISFFGQPRDRFVEALNRCGGELQPYDNFDGMGIHDYTGFDLLD